MTIQTRTTLKTYFNKGDKPTEAQFANLIDSCLNLSDTASQTIKSPIIVSGATYLAGGGTTITVSADTNNGSFATTACVVSAVSDATTSILASILNLVYPIGTIYENASDPTNPATLLNFTSTWVSLGAGRVTIGVGTGTDGNGDTLTVSAGDTGGEYNHTLTANEMPAHTHNQNGLSSGGTPGAPYYILSNGMTTTNVQYAATTSAGGDQKHNNTQPYITVYRWKRTA